MKRARNRAWGVYLLGGDERTVGRMSSAILGATPAVRVVGHASPAVDMDQPSACRADALADIRQSGADLVLVALGSPTEELFIDEAMPCLRSMVLMGVGACLGSVVETAPRSRPQRLSCCYEFLRILAEAALEDDRRRARIVMGRGLLSSRMAADSPGLGDPFRRRKCFSKSS